MACHDTVIDRTVAIKMLLPHFAQDPKFEQRFRREARAVARLDDPHVVPIHDSLYQWWLANCET
jgi:serine/threonine-protein kinase